MRSGEVKSKREKIIRDSVALMEIPSVVYEGLDKIQFKDVMHGMHVTDVLKEFDFTSEYQCLRLRKPPGTGALASFEKFFLDPASQKYKKWKPAFSFGPKVSHGYCLYKLEKHLLTTDILVTRIQSQEVDRSLFRCENVIIVRVQLVRSIPADQVRMHRSVGKLSSST